MPTENIRIIYKSKTSKPLYHFITTFKSLIATDVVKYLIQYHLGRTTTSRSFRREVIGRNTTTVN